MTIRIAHVLNSPGRGGVPRVAHALVRHSRSARIRNHVFYLKPGNGADLFVDMDIPRRVATSGSKATAMVELVAWLDANRIDILHSHSFRPNIYARMAGAVLKPAGLRIVAHYHNDDSGRWQGETLVLERRLAALTDGALAVSDAVAETVEEKTGMKAEVLENGVDMDRVSGGCREAGRAALGLPTAALAVGLIGRICRQKGVDIFVEAAIAVCSRNPRAHFVIVGDAEDAALAARLGDLIAAAGLENRITFAGHREDLADTLAALDLVAAPSRWEGFGLCLAEAMAAGVPVVASAVGGIPSVTGQAGRLVPPEDPGALASAIEDLLEDRPLRDVMARAGRVEAARFDWAPAAERLVTLYHRLGARA